MKLHRFFDDFNEKEKYIVITSSNVVHQLTHVLRIKKQEKFILCNGKGKEVLVQVRDIHKTNIEVEVIETFESIPEPQRKVTLYAALIKGEHFEMIIEKATEIGIYEIVPIITHRTIKLKVKTDRLQKIIQEAAEQSGRGRVPLLQDPVSLKEAILQAAKHEQIFFCDFQAPSLFGVNLKNTRSVGCFIGPEGGWDDQERELAHQEGLIPVSLSHFTFRAETAAIVSAAILCQ